MKRGAKLGPWHTSGAEVVSAELRISVGEVRHLAPGHLAYGADEVLMINEYFTGGPGSPFGGYKQSGIGRERGLLALQNYTQVKNVVVRVGRSSPGPESRE